jgi:hypothetical protein
MSIDATPQEPTGPPPTVGVRRKAKAGETYGIGAKEIAALCGVDERTAARWKAGTTCPPESALMILRRDLGCFDERWKGWTINGGDIVSPEGWAIDRNHALTVPLMHGQISALRQKIATLEKALAAAGGAPDTDWEIEISIGPPGQTRVLRASSRDLGGGSPAVSLDSMGDMALLPARATS